MGAVGCGLLVSVALLMTVPENASALGAYVLLSSTIGLCAAAIYSCVADRRPTPVLFISLIYFVFYLAGPALLHIRSERFPFFSKHYPPEFVNESAVVVLIFVAAMLLGHSLSKSRPIVSGYARGFSPSSSTFWIVAFALSSIVFALFFGISRLTALRGETVALGPASPFELISRSLARALSFFALFLAVITLSRTRTFFSLLVALAVIPVFLVLNNPLSLPRYISAAYILSFALFFTDFRPLVRLVLLAGMAVAQLTLFPLLSVLSRGDVRYLSQFSPARYLSTSGDFDGFQSVINVVMYTESAGFQFGRNLLSAILFFVPRSVWAGKTPGTGVDAARAVGYEFTNISAPLPAELFVDFGYIGLVAGALAFGIFISKLDQLYVRSRQENYVAGLLFVSVFSGYLFIILRGSLVGVVGPAVLSLCVIGLLGSLSPKSQRAAAPPAPTARHTFAATRRALSADGRRFG